MYTKPNSSFCPSTLTITDNPANGIYEAGNTIITSGAVSIDAMATFLLGNLSN